jgi:hypothetical protein
VLGGRQRADRRLCFRLPGAAAATMTALPLSMRLSGAEGVRRWRPLSLRGPSGSPRMALIARGAMDWDSGCASGRTRVGSFVTGSLGIDAAGRRRSPATMPGFHAGRPPRNKGLRYPADPPTVEEIVAVMRIAGDGVHGRRLRGLVVVLWRAGLRIDERSRCARPTSIDAAVPARPARQGRATSRGRDGRLGLAGA